MEFGFYKDTKLTIWERVPFTIEASDQEEAELLVKNMFNEDIGVELEEETIMDREFIYDTCEEMSVEGNGGAATIEIYSKEHKFILDNTTTS